MKILHKKLTPIALTIGLSLSSMNLAQAQGIPTIDAAAIAQAMQQLLTMKEQIENQVSQITELKNQVTALTSLDGLRNATQDLTLDNIPAEWRDIYSNVDALSQADVDDILSIKDYDPDNGQKILANYTTSLESAFKETTDRFTRLNGLQQRLQTANNVKEAADIQNQIATESAAIAVTQTQLDNMHRTYEIQKEIHIEQRKHNSYCNNAEFFNWDTRGKCD